jgi:RNA polymerase sigma-70 factor, ECF subfamily
MDSLDRMQREEMLRSAVLAGNENAWRTWYDESFDGLCRYVRWRCGGRRDWADEIVQETWLTAVRSVRRFDPRKGSFLAWLRGVAANLLRNDLRKRRRAPKFQQTTAGQIGESDKAAWPVDDRHQQETVAAALDALSEREEAVLRAKYLDGLSVAEIAAQRGDSPKAIESLLSRARQAFREVYCEKGTAEVAGETNVAIRNGCDG